MKKLFFAAIAAIAMVSVSNVFANGTKNSTQFTTVSDTTVTAPVAQPDTTNGDTTSTVSDTAGQDDTAMLMSSDTTGIDSTQTGTTDSVSAPATV